MPHPSASCCRQTLRCRSTMDHAPLDCQHGVLEFMEALFDAGVVGLVASSVGVLKSYAVVPPAACLHLFCCRCPAHARAADQGRALAAPAHPGRSPCGHGGDCRPLTITQRVWKAAGVHAKMWKAAKQVCTVCMGVPAPLHRGPRRSSPPLFSPPPWPPLLLLAPPPA